MFNVTATWNQACRSIAGAATLYLGVRISPKPRTARTPVYGVVLLDLSRSMEGEKLAATRQALQTLWQQLRDGDWLSVVTFSTTSSVLMPWTEKRHSDSARLDAALAGCRASGVTHLRPALVDAMRLAGQAPKEAGRFIWLMTDGDPTDAEGKRVTNLQPFLNAASEAATAGVTMFAIGLGNAELYRAEFLRDLSDHGRGSFCYAATLDRLSAQLQTQLAGAQEVVMPNASLSLDLEPGNQLLAAARVVPTYVPLEVPSAKGRWSLALGSLTQPETVLLLEIATAAPLMAEVGIRQVGTLRIRAESGGPPWETSSPLALRLERPGSPEILKRDSLIEGLRYSMLLVRNEALRLRARTAEEKLRATEVMIDLVQQTGDTVVREKLQAEGEQLRQNQELTCDQEASMMQDVRATSRLVYHRQVEREGGSL